MADVFDLAALQAANSRFRLPETPKPRPGPVPSSPDEGVDPIKNVGAESARLMVEEKERHGPYVTAGDLVRRTGLKPRAILSLAMAGAFDAIAPNRREALWEAGLHSRPSRNGQVALPMPTEDSVPRLPDFTEREKMVGEYRVMGIYPWGHLMELVRPGLGPGVLPAVDVEKRGDDERVTVAGCPVARQHPRGAGRHGLRDHRGRDGRRAGHRLERSVRQAPQGARQPGGGGHWARVAVGRDYERDSDRPARRPLRRLHAAVPRLALRYAAAAGTCAATTQRCIMGEICADDTA